MLDCKQVSRIIASDQLATAGWRRRLAVRLHLLMCRHCRRYAAQLRQIGRAARQLFGEQRLDPAARDRLRRTILERLQPPADEDRRPSV